MYQNNAAGLWKLSLTLLTFAVFQEFNTTKENAVEGGQSRYFELFWVTTKLPLNWKIMKKGVCPHFQAFHSSSKILRCALYFQLSSRCFGNVAKLVFDIFTSNRINMKLYVEWAEQICTMKRFPLTRSTSGDLTHPRSRVLSIEPKSPQLKRG